MDRIEHLLDLLDSIDTAGLDRWSAAVAACRFDADASDGDLLAVVASAERLKDACAAMQARATHEYSERRLAALTVGSKPDRDARRDIAATIARARRVSPTHGSRYLELARMLVRDLPRTLDALAAGQTTEYRAGLVAHAAACLGTDDRATLDADLGPRLAGRGNRSVQGEADRIAAELDAAAVVERHRLAAQDRRVTLRPAPDTMTYLTALLPVADGVATWAALDRHATLARSAGDRRSRGQLMADELSRRLLYGTATEVTSTGSACATTSVSGTDDPGAVAVECRLPSSESGARLASACTETHRSPDADSRPADDPAGASGACKETRDSPHSAKSPTTLSRSYDDDGSARSDHVGSDQRRAAAEGSCRSDSEPPRSPGDPTALPPPTLLDGGSPNGPPSDGNQDHPPHTPVPPVRQIDLMLVMTDRALLDGADTAAVIPGFGPMPAALARGMLADADPATRVFLRRLYTDPSGDQLLTADARGRRFPHAVRQFVLARDQRCRTRFCDAPIRHIDHTVPHAAGGPTKLGNDSGLCERCSLSKGSRTDDAVQPGPAPKPPRSAPWPVPDRAAVGVR